MPRALFVATATLALAGFSWSASAALPIPRVPDGFEIEVAAEPPVVERPVMACFDERGRLFLVDSSGANEPFEKLVKNPPHRIVVIEDTDGDGKFDKRTVFADKLVMPQGVLPYRGAVYTASPPSVWKLEDTNGDGVCDKRTEVVTEFGSNGNAADIHGPFLGPDGWLYLCDGRHGHKVKLDDGKIDQGLAGGIFRFRTDGSGFERVCGGGFDNPVEIDFTDEGEILGTVNILHGNPRQDCLIHWVEGGVYPRADQEQCIAEFKRTGELLPPIKEFGHVAVAGMCRYRSEGFGPEYRNNLFIAFFNRHKVIRSILERSGSTFTSREEEFLVSEEKDFHPTDVLEDADGSLLVINTGGWFRIGCPVSEIAKPDLLGAIYRIRKKGMKKIDDPRGLSQDLKKRSAKELVPFLDDPRWAVRERAVELLATADAASTIYEINNFLQNGRDRATVRQKQNAGYALCRASRDEINGLIGDSLVRDRIGANASLWSDCVDSLLMLLKDPNDDVRLAAAIFIGTAFRRTTPQQLQKMVVEDNPAIRRAAATAIGANRIGPRRIVSGTRSTRLNDGKVREAFTKDDDPLILAIFQSLKTGPIDRLTEHSLIHALITINNREETLPFLKDSHPEVRRAALIALDQMDDGNLTRELVMPLLDTDDPQLRKTALAVISARKGWATELIGLLRGWLAVANPSGEQLSLLRGVLLAQAEDSAIQQVISEALSAATTAPPVRLLLWEVIYRAPLPDLPRVWLAEIGRTLAAGSAAEIRQSVAIVNERVLAQFDPQLVANAADQSAAIELRVEALAAAAPRMKSLEREQFLLLSGNFKPDSPPLLLLASARGLADAPLSLAQLRELTALLPAASPLTLPVLLQAFAKTDDETVGAGLVTSLKQSPAAENLPAEALAAVLRKYPDSVQKEGGPLLARLGGASLGEQQARLKELAKLLDPPGDVKRGRQVFLSRKAACSSCHTVAGEGGRVGPDLTKIGASRSGTDLLEAVVFPSATFAREFRPYVIVTDSGKTFTGVISRQTTDSIHLRTADLAEIRIPRAAIEEMKDSNTSIMPKGLDSTLSADELRDLLAYLQQLK